MKNYFVSLAFLVCGMPSLVFSQSGAIPASTISAKPVSSYSVEKNYKNLLIQIKKDKSKAALQEFTRKLGDEITKLEMNADESLTQPNWKLEEELIRLMAWQQAFKLYELENDCSKLSDKLILSFAPKAQSEADLPSSVKAVLETCRAFSY